MSHTKEKGKPLDKLIDDLIIECNNHYRYKVVNNQHLGDGEVSDYERERLIDRVLLISEKKDVQIVSYDVFERLKQERVGPGTVESLIQKYKKKGRSYIDEGYTGFQYHPSNCNMVFSGGRARDILVPICFTLMCVDHMQDIMYSYGDDWFIMRSM
jgi:hypothetical protein